MNEQETQDYLDALDANHNPQGVEEGFSSLPDGKYKARLDKLYFSRSKNETHPRNQCTFEFEVISGDFASRKINKFAGMETGDSLDWLTRDLRRVGIITFKWSDVSKQFPNALDKLFELELKTKKTAKGEFQSVYIQKELKRDEVMLSKTISGGKDTPPF